MATLEPASPASTLSSSQKAKPLTRRGFVYEPAIGPRLKVLLFAIFASVAFLGATGAYLTSIRVLEWSEARLALEVLAEGPSDSAQTDEARRALARLRKRP